MTLNIKFWLKISLLNLCIVAALGVLMRYKIGFDFPYFEQKNLQHSHYNFAFSGWISHTLIILMIHYLQTKINGFNGNKYKTIIIAYLTCSYGLLISYIIPRLDLLSIIFSTLSVFVSYVFCYQFIKDLKQLDNEYLVRKWFSAALFFNVLSSLGTFYLAYMMISKNIVQDVYLSSVYFYLHFQYNGWFFFA
jgi:cytochrome bd-type quinol oxidase subunit 1